MSEATSTAAPAAPAATGRQQQLHNVNGRPLPRVRAGAAQAAVESLDAKLARQRMEVACAQAYAQGKRDAWALAERTYKKLRIETAWFSAGFGLAIGLIVSGLVLK